MNNNAKKLRALKHYCYVITNIFNDKVYVGVTYKLLNERLKEHIKKANSKNKKTRKTINNAIRKYGKDNFKIELLEKFDNAELAFAAEIKYIKKYDSKKYGYNETNGGDSGPPRIIHKLNTIINVIEDYCNHISLKQIAEKYNMKYTSVCDITRLRISKIHRIPKKLLKKLQEAKNNSPIKNRTNMLIVPIINKFINGLTLQQIADEYRLSLNTVWRIIHRISWPNIDIGLDLEQQLKEKLLSSNDGARNKKRKHFSNELVEQIKLEYSYGNLTYKQLGEKYNRCEQSINLLMNDKTYIKNITDLK